MSSLFALSPYSKRLLFLKKFDMYTLYRLPLFLGSVGLFLSTLISVGAFADVTAGTMVENYVPQLVGSSYILARCNNKLPGSKVRYLTYMWWNLKCNTLFLEPVIKGKPLTKYAHTYYPAKYCTSSKLGAHDAIEMSPIHHTIVKTCVVKTCVPL